MRLLVCCVVDYNATTLGIGGVVDGLCRAIRGIRKGEASPFLIPLEQCNDKRVGYRLGHRGSWAADGMTLGNTLTKQQRGHLVTPPH